MSDSKGCPFIGFKPCEPDRCKFYQRFGSMHDGCIFLSHYVHAFLMSGNIIDLISALAKLRLLEPKEFSSPEAYSEHIDSVKEHVDFLIPRLLDLQKQLKDVGG